MPGAFETPRLTEWYMSRSLSPLFIAIWLSIYAAAFISCGGEEAPRCENGPTLFGRPSAMTGLTSDQCAPSCSCGAEGKVWTAPEYSADEVAALLEWKLENPPDELLSDPYLLGEPETRTGDEVCAVMKDSMDKRRYRLESFESPEAAIASGGHITHTGPCGLCSSLADLAVYLGRPDLTDPVRACGAQNLPPAEDLYAKRDEHIACLLELDFTLPCAQIWYYNTLNTRLACIDSCIALLGAPHHNPDGSLNECIQCDEDISGPVFKAYAGRTRRNTAMASELCRPCEEVFPIEHDYARD